MVEFYLKYAGGNFYINNILVAYSEGLGNYIAGYIQISIGTKKSFLI